MAEWFTWAGTAGTVVTSIYLGGGHMLRWLRKIVNAMVVARLEELSHQVEEHHDEIHQPEYGIRPQLSNLRQRVAHLEGIHDRKSG